MEYLLLEQAGVDVEQLKKRLLQNEKMIKMFIDMFIKDKTFESLLIHISEKNYEAAKDDTHKLKGITGNIAVTELYDLFIVQLNLFRQNKTEEAVSMMPLIKEKYEHTIEYMKKWMESL